MPPTRATKGRNRAAKERKARGFLNLCAILAEDDEFLASISECTDPVTLNAHVFASAQVTEYKHNLLKSDAFAKVKTILGTYSCEQLPLSIQILHQACREHTLRTKQPRQKLRTRKKKTAKRIGFQETLATIIQPWELIEL
jgi:hypothetical protein